jgi:SpoVK/Ycf46/Vps4 family AAA+-type ATPase
MEEMLGLLNGNCRFYDKETEFLIRYYVKELGRRLHLSGEEVRSFSQIFKECAWDGYVLKSELADSSQKNLTGAGALYITMQQLEMKGLVTRKNSISGKVSYSIPTTVSRDVYNNCTPEIHTGLLDAYSLADRITDLIHRSDNDSVCFEDVYQMLIGLIVRNPELAFCSRFNSWTLTKEESLFVAYIYAITLMDHPIIHTDYAISRVFGNSGRGKSLLKSIQEKRGNLFDLKIICHADEEFETGNRIMFTEESYSHLFEESEKQRLRKSTSKNRVMPLIKVENIPAKPLHYNQKEEKDIQQLEQCFEEKNYRRISTELEEMGQTSGITVMLYGPPGTGKTETVMQLARSTGRDILKIDIATLRDKYVGESEKQIKRIFDQYREQLRDSKPVPILLMNEADGIISSRTKQVLHSTDQMHNAMQNIFLEELERFKGILIATTNFTDKLDPAFERRFLYKLKMEAPSQLVRMRIITDRIHHLNNEQASHLAEQYQLSGGQLDNISRKITTSKLLNGKYPSFEEIKEHFKSERLERKEIKKIIGFQSGN